MTEQPPPATADPTALTSIAIQEIQALTDIEQDLADTAAAVSALNPIIDEDEEMLQNAEAVENVLEQSIPGAPVAALLEETTQSAITALDTSAVPESSSSVYAVPVAEIEVAQIADAAVQSIEITPADDPEAAIDVIADTLHDETVSISSETRDTIPSQEPSSVTQTTSAISNGHSEQNNTAAPTPSSTAALPPLPPADQTSIAPIPAKPITQTPYAALQASASSVDLPEGLSDASASVLANPDLIRQWQADPTNSSTLLALFNWGVLRSEVVDARAWYELLAKDEPTAIQPLLALINLELALSNFTQVEALFAKALKGPSGGMTAAADVSIWKAYLHYIRRQNPITEGSPNVEAARATVTKAYEFALKECGTDRESGDVWQEYISFVGEPSPKNTWETQQQMDNLRKVYQRAVCIPLNNVEALWKAYDAFESGLNKLTAKKFLAERSPAYMTARTALRELRNLTDSLPHPILPPRPTFSDSDRTTVAGWRAYLKWEEGNPLVIDDAEALSARVAYALRKCLGEMRHFPELWHYAAQYYLKDGKKEDAAGVLTAGVEACPKSVLLTFALADVQEDLKNIPTIHTLYETILTHLNTDIEKLKVTVAAEVDTARGPEIVATANVGDVDMDEEISRLVEEREERGKLVAERRGREVDELCTSAGVVWIMYMRFARRAEGIKAARGVFGKARKSSHMTWHIFEASAMMEYHSNKDSSVAIRIFELGFKLFSEEVDYVVRYLQFLLSVNDDSNARALFERSAAKIPSDKSRPLWDAWARYEYMYGDLAAVHKLESRFAETFPNDSPLKRFAQRFTYNGIDQIAVRDLGFGIGPRSIAASTRPTPIQAPLPPPHPSLPPPPQSLPQPPQLSPSNKRPLDSSPSQRRPSIDHSAQRPRSPEYKRQRPTSPPRRFDGRPRYSRDRSPLPPQQLPPQLRRDDRGGSQGMGGGVGGPPQGIHIPQNALAVQGGGVAPRDQLDVSGLTRPLVWFIGNLPSNRAFDGPVFRPEDIMGLFSSIGANGLGGGGGGGGGGGMGGPPPPGRMGYAEPERRYGGGGAQPVRVRY